MKKQFGAQAVEDKNRIKFIFNNAESYLLKDLLAYSRINATERIFEKTDLNVIIEEVKTDLKEAIEEKHAIIESTELCTAYIVPFQFRQIFQNLISNALKFSNPEIPPHITIRSTIVPGSTGINKFLLPEKEYCHITVRDNGIGFEPEYSERIFEVFQRLHEKEEYAGTGIGLAIVKKIVGPQLHCHCNKRNKERDAI